MLLKLDKLSSPMTMERVHPAPPMETYKCLKTTFLGVGRRFFFSCVACGICVPLTRTELMPPAVEGRSVNYWATTVKS